MYSGVVLKIKAPSPFLPLSVAPPHYDASHWSGQGSASFIDEVRRGIARHLDPAVQAATLSAKEANRVCPAVSSAVLCAVGLRRGGGFPVILVSQEHIIYTLSPHDTVVRLGFDGWLGPLNSRPSLRFVAMMWPVCACACGRACSRAVSACTCDGVSVYVLCRQGYTLVCPESVPRARSTHKGR